MRYEITIDAPDFDANVDYDDASIDAFVALANDANANVTNVVVVPTNDARFANDVTLAFDATPDAIARYVAYYDAPDDAITPA